MKDQRLPDGWDASRLRALVEELDARTEEQWLAADEAAATDSEKQVAVTVPKSLMPAVRRLLAAHRPEQPV